MIPAKLETAFITRRYVNVTNAVWQANGGRLGDNWCLVTSVMDGQGQELRTVFLFNSLPHIRSSSTI